MEKGTTVDNPYAIDHSERFSIIAQLHPNRSGLPTPYWDLTELSEKLPRVLEEAVATAAADVLGAVLPARPSAAYYQVGPAAEQLPACVITVWEQVQDVAPILSGIADAWAVTQIIRRVHARLQDWVEASGKRSVRPHLVLTPYDLAKLCEDHVRRTYHPRAKLSAAWFVTNLQSPDYGFPAHPIGMEEYLVTVTAGRKTYCYAIDSYADVKSHYMKEGKRLTPLATPTLLPGAEF